MFIPTPTSVQRETTFGRFPDQKGKPPAQDRVGVFRNHGASRPMLSGGTAEGPVRAKRRMQSFSGSQERDTGTQGYFIPELNSSVAIRGCSMQGYQTQHPLYNNRKCALLQLDSKPGRRHSSRISMRASVLPPPERLSGNHGPQHKPGITPVDD